MTEFPSRAAAAVRRLVKVLFRFGGLEVSRWGKSPKHTLLGLRNLPIASIVDVGANEGQFAKWISTFFPLAHIYAFEPLPGPYAKLKAWAERRPGKVTTFNVALGDISKDVVMNLDLDHTPSSSLLMATSLNDRIYPHTRRRTTVSVRQESLDQALARVPVPLEPEILVKLDVQGYEDRVISGGQQTLARARACIIEVGLDQLYAGQACFPDLLRLLGQLGFAYGGSLEQAYDHDGHVVWFDAVFVRESKSEGPSPGF
jgi:FkbM family methyltransferase